MSSEGKIDSGEKFVLLSFLAISLTFFFRSFSYPDQAALFPQFTASIVILGTILILTGDHLPSPVKEFVKEESGLLDRSNKEIEKTQRETKPDPTLRDKLDIKINNSSFTMGLIIFYGFSSYLIGIFLSTPIFVVLYAIWFQMTKRSVIFLIIASIIIMISFQELLNVNLDRGLFIPRGALP